MDMKSLIEKTCVPCRGGIPRLGRAEVSPYLSGVEHWQPNDDLTRISRRFRFKNFRLAQAFSNRVAALAEEQNHHPEITTGWGYCAVMFQTHKILGLHENDFIMAAKVDALFAEENP